MGPIQVNQENEGTIVVPASNNGKKSSFGSQQKSLIPVPKASSSPKNNENGNVGTVLVQKPRKPLAPMQNADSPLLGKSLGKFELRKSESNGNGTPTKVKCLEKSTGTNKEVTGLPVNVQLHRNFPGTPQNSPSKLKTRKSSVTGTGSSKAVKSKADVNSESDESIAYWKELAESRRQALNDALQENYDLHKRIEELEKENANLEEIVKEAEKLAIMSAAEEDDFAGLDESGIGEATEGTAV